MTLFGVVFVQSAKHDTDVDVTKEDEKNRSISSEPQNNLSGSPTEEKDNMHKRYT